MAQHYSARAFFRQMPNQLLARFFNEIGLFADLDFSSMKETKPDKLFTAWLDLAEKTRNKIDAILQEIFEMSCQKGFVAIIDEASWQLRNKQDTLANFIETLSELPNHYYRAITTYLDHPEYWKGATRFYHADTLSYWRKRKQMGHNNASTDKASIKQLEDSIRKYFHYTEGRGNNCIVEVFRRGDLDYFFAYPEDYSQQSIEWVDGTFDRRPHNPAFEIIYVYSQKEGKLDLNFSGSPKAVEPLQHIFATTILKLDALPPIHKDNCIYDLNQLRHRSFNFTYSVDSGINCVATKKIRLSSRIKKGDRITLEGDTSHNKFAIYDQLEDIGKAIPLHLYNVTQVEIIATIAENANKPAKNTTIRLTHPNSCSLKYDNIDLKLRKMLETSGIEPKDPGTNIETTEPPAV